MMTSESRLLETNNRMDPQTLNLQMTLENQNSADSSYIIILKIWQLFNLMELVS